MRSLMRQILFVAMFVIVFVARANAQNVHTLSSGSSTLTCGMTGGTSSYSTDIYKGVLSSNTAPILPAASANCNPRDHIEIFGTQGTNQAYTLVPVAGSGTVIKIARLDGSMLALPPSVNGATNVVLHQIYVYDPTPSTPQWELVQQSTEPATGNVGLTDFSPMGLGRVRGSYMKAAFGGHSAWDFWASFNVAIVPSNSAVLPSIVQVGTFATGAGSALTIPALANAPTSGNLLIAIPDTPNSGSTTWTPPGGWAVLACSTNNTLCSYWKISNGSETTVAFTSSQNGLKGVLMEWTGAAAPSSPPSSAATGTTGIPVTGSITTASANNVVLNCDATQWNRWGFSPPAGFTPIIDPVTQVNKSFVPSATLNQGLNNLMLWSSGTFDGYSSIACFQKPMVSAGATGSVSVYAGFPLIAYSGSGGEIDHLHEIIRGGGGGDGIAGNLSTFTFWRDGEATPSIDHIQTMDFVFARNADQPRLDTKYISFLNTGGGDTQAGRYVTIPWTTSITGFVTNPDTTASDISGLWNNIDTHANSFGNTGWGSHAHYLIATNSSYPSTDSVAAYTEKTLLDVSGAGALESIYLKVTGHDNNSQDFEEGPIRIYIDGESTPTYISSGTEDFLNSSFNWEYLLGNNGSAHNIYATDFYGTTHYTAPSGVPGQFGGFRFYGDKQPVEFTSHLKVTWAAGLSGVGTVTNNVDVLSLVGYYLSK